MTQHPTACKPVIQSSRATLAKKLLMRPRLIGIQKINLEKINKGSEINSAKGRKILQYAIKILCIFAYVDLVSLQMHIYGTFAATANNQAVSG